MKALKICRAALTVLLILISVGAAALVLVLFKQGFTYRAAMQGIQYLLPLFMSAVALSFAALAVNKRLGRETVQKFSRAQPYCDREMPERGKNILRSVIVCAAVLLILLGITNGGLWDVLVKAINICTECIGLG